MELSLPRVKLRPAGAQAADVRSEDRAVDVAGPQLCERLQGQLAVEVRQREQRPRRACVPAIPAVALGGRHVGQARRRQRRGREAGQVAARPGRA